MIRLDDIEIGRPSPTAAVNLIAPADESVDIPLNPQFVWTEAAISDVVYHLQISKNSAGFWEYEYMDINETTFQLPVNLDPSSTYYWRVGWKNDLLSGDWSELFSFTTGMMISSNEEELINSSIRIYPNPASTEQVFFNKITSGQLLDIRGKVIRNVNMQQQMDVSNLSSGLYIFRSDDNQHIKLMIIQD